MELELHRVDLLQTAAAAPGTLVVSVCFFVCWSKVRSAAVLSRRLTTTVTQPNGIDKQVLPPGAKKTQKVAVGDCSGVVQCFSVKRGEVALSFKSMPAAQKVTSVSLGRHPQQRDRIFTASGNQVRLGMGEWQGAVLCLLQGL